MAPSNEENSRPTKVDDSFHISEQIKDSGDEVTIVKSDDKTISSSSSEDNVIKDSERAGFQWEYEQFLAKFTFFLDLGWKAVGLFYAVLGGILAIYFTKEVKEPSVVKFLLYAPFYMSIILSLIFFGCGILWWRLISKVSVLNNLCKRVVLEAAVWQPVFKYYSELVHRSAPVGNRHCPPFADISQG